MMVLNERQGSHHGFVFVDRTPCNWEILISPRSCLRLSRSGSSFLFCILFTVAPVLYGAPKGSISGKILDPKNNPVSAAHLRLADFSGVTVRESSTDAQGQFVFESLQPGSYRLIAEANSFSPLSREILLAAGQYVEVAFQFTQLSPVLQSITVVAASPSVADA